MNGRVLIFGTVAAGLACVDLAQARPSTTSYTCAELRSVVARRGGVTMNVKGPHVYRRLVTERTQCLPGQATQRFYVPARQGRCEMRICFDPVLSGAPRRPLQP